MMSPQQGLVALQLGDNPTVLVNQGWLGCKYFPPPNLEVCAFFVINQSAVRFLNSTTDFCDLLF